VKLVGTGEGLGDLEVFDTREFIDGVFAEEDD
jgi:signal recognition particle GTPase